MDDNKEISVNFNFSANFNTIIQLQICYISQSMFEKPTVSLNELCNLCAKSRFVRPRWYSLYRIWASASKTREISMSLYAPYFYKLCSNPKNKNLTELGLEIPTALPRLPFRNRHVLIWTFLLTMTNTVTSQNIYTSCWIALYLEEVSRISKRQKMINKCVHDA